MRSTSIVFACWLCSIICMVVVVVVVVISNFAHVVNIIWSNNNTIKLKIKINFVYKYNTRVDLYTVVETRLHNRRILKFRYIIYQLS